MISLRIDPAVATLLVIAFSAMWLLIGYVMGFGDAYEDAFGDFEEEKE